VNDATFASLSTLKTWFGTKTPSDTIDRIVAEAMEQLGIEREDSQELVPAKGLDGAMEFDVTPGLTFTKPLSATINRKSVAKPRWSSMLLAMIAQLKAKGFDGERLVRELQVPARAERYEEEGFKYYSDLGISVQGQSAAEAWKEIDRIAKKWSIPVEIEFWWRQNPKAQYPGKMGRLRSGNA